MADDYFGDDDSQGEQIDPNSRAFVRKLEADKKAEKERADALQAENDRLRAIERESVLAKAGIDLNTPTGKLFAEAYKGELTAEAIKAKASEYGIVSAQEQQLNNEAATLSQLGNNAGAGGQQEEDFFVELGKTNSTEEVLAMARKLGIPVSGEVPGKIAPLIFN